MGYKQVCFKCRKSFSIGTDSTVQHGSICPNCGDKMICVDQKFKPPKKSDDRRWEVVRYLVENGFRFQHILSDEGKNITCPQTMKEAEDFVGKYMHEKRNE